MVSASRNGRHGEKLLSGDALPKRLSGRPRRSGQESARALPYSEGKGRSSLPGKGIGTTVSDCESVPCYGRPLFSLQRGRACGELAKLGKFAKLGKNGGESHPASFSPISPETEPEASKGKRKGGELPFGSARTFERVAPELFFRKEAGEIPSLCGYSFAFLEGVFSGPARGKEPSGTR